MARWRGTTAQRGYGPQHQAERGRLLKRWQPGDPCVRCGKPMYGPPSRIHLGHTEDRTGYTGLEHADCNCAEGATRGNHARQFTPAAAGSNVICRSCGKPYHYAARACEMCGAHYHPSYGEQRTCGRACGVALSRRNRRAAGWVPKSERPKPPPKPRYAPVRSGERDPKNGWPSSRLQHYTCRYCAKRCVAKATVQPREVCPARACQLARLMANNLRTRNGLTKEDADAQMATLVGSGQPSRVW